MNILITGGAGYIGSHAVLKACREGHTVIVIDNLFRGFKECIETLQQLFPNQITFYKVDIRDKDKLEEVFQKEKIDAVMHFAALLSVNESMQIPYLYFQNNTYGTLNLLECLQKYKIKNIVFSSTCATYASKIISDSPDLSQYSIDENNDQIPESVYGESKLLTEKEIKWFGKIYEINYTILRYFNVCGCNNDGLIGYSTRPSMLLMQNAVRGALEIEPFQFTCGTVNTPDGFPIRDYINVEDLVDVHFLSLEKMLKDNKSNIYNVGTGEGNSVKEIVDKVMALSHHTFNIVQGDVRAGEAPALYANTNKIYDELNWKAKRSIEDSINSLIKWYQKKPQGWSY